MEKDKARLQRPFAKKKKLEQDLERISQEMYKRNLELAETNQALSLLRTIDNLVLESHDELAVLCQNVAKAIIDHSTFPVIAIMANPPHKQFLELFGWASSYEAKPDLGSVKLSLENHNKWFVSEERTVKVDLSSLSDEHIAHVLHQTPDQINSLRKTLPVKSAVIVKLVARQRLVGLMMIGFGQETSAITEKETLLVDRLSEAVGIALDNQLLSEENLQVLSQLKRTNKKLKALDETKDEFISMASHQLRTPLTSVKGYLSMVLEGDAGKITKAQEKLLDQAFVSSQRMVYLIADLLNVSRLRTGKFVIELVPTNLAEVIEGEVEQLQETASSRNLTLTYKKPAKFPTVLLDETKIRQVIMNFMDNAIYYTPTGGHIVAELKETDKTVEFTVTDDGIGVPKSEQHHLFGKFYRAGNAKKARPDGTGLGLFMAKKVVVVQGGALIFRSQEGKGSTFGFSFEKAKLKESKATDTADENSGEKPESKPAKA